MDLSVVFLGTGGSVPSARRATACVLIRAGGARVLVDCGEGAQRQMINSTGLVQVDDIFITHFHADHYLGLPGLLKTYDLMERRAPLRIVGPEGLDALFEALRRIFGRLRYQVELIELGPGERIEHEGFEMGAFEVEHGMKALGYAYIEQERPGRFDVDAARGLGITDDRDFGRLQRGETISVNGSEVRPDQVMGEQRPGRKVVVTGDTSPCEMTRIAALAAQLLIHDGTFAIEESARAAETGHSTARDAAQLAAEAEVAMLAIVHVSSRYNVSAVLA
jgi:ribonuclease Z